MRLTLVRCSGRIRDELAAMRAPKLENKTISDYFQWLFKNRDFTLQGFKEKYELRKLDQIRQVNCFQDQDFGKLGPDLHSATYTIRLGGRFRLAGSSRWIGLDEHNTKISDILPEERTGGFKVEGLDLSKTVIQAEGISNIENCLGLKTLILSDCYFVNDWLLSTVSHVFSDRLEVLDLSGCKEITDNGLETLVYLSKLKKLCIKNLDGAFNKEFISILLEDHIQGLEVEGVDHLSEETLRRVEERILAESKANQAMKEMKY